MNTLYYGDNLQVLRNDIKNNSIDLIYLDPPFNSKADYNILYKEPNGSQSKAQITAFEDTWHWTDEAEKTFQEIIEVAPANVIEMMRAFRSFIGNNDMMAYLTMMCIRLIELKRVLKETGSIYLHCDPTASHYLKIVLDSIFGKENFRNEIIRKRTFSHGSAKRFGPVHDVILFYSKGEDYIWMNPTEDHDPKYIAEHFNMVDESGRQFQPISLTGPGITQGDSGKSWKNINPTKVGRHWAIPDLIIKKLQIVGSTTQEKLDALDNAGMIYWPKKSNGTPRLKWYADQLNGTAIQDIWMDFPQISAKSAERLGYPTQKPEELLERILNASSKEGDLILDPFCGCGTAISAAQKLKRQWIGIDVTHLAINVMKLRMKHEYGLEAGKNYKVIGEPEDLAGAIQLSKENRYQFQWWALSLINARPYGDKKKGADTGIDGYLYFSDKKNEVKSAIVQVKSGGVGVKDIRDLGHTIDRDKSEIGIFITLEEPTKPMETEAVAKGFYQSEALNKKFHKIEILTIRELFEGKRPEISPYTISPYRIADKFDKENDQLELT